MALLLLADDRVLEHRPSPGHPERPERFTAAMDGVHQADFGEALILRTPTEAPTESLRRVHTDAHVDFIEELGAHEQARIDADTMMSSGSLTAARLAAGAGLDAITALDNGEADAAFCMVRPPGHHARPQQAMGFCLFNNVAVTARALADRGERVAIVDFDAHHGNGTQDVFYDSEDVLFVSLHEYPQYPGTGAITETGAGAGLGTTINLPLPSGATGDVYLRAFDEVIAPAIEAHRTNWLLISAGFDAHRADPLTNLGLTSGDYGLLTARLIEMSAPGRRIAFLEGGYDLTALGDSAAATIGAMLGVDHLPEAVSNGGPGMGVVDALQTARDA